MRKKYLREHVRSCKKTIEELSESNTLLFNQRQSMEDKLTSVLRLNVVLEDEIAHLKAQRETPVGPGRPNRTKLTDTEVYEIRVKHRHYGIKQKYLAQRYGVNPSTISRIVRRVYHK